MPFVRIVKQNKAMSIAAVLFDYREGRGREGPTKLLKDYQGYLQTDGYGVYERTSNARFDQQVRSSQGKTLS
jgi:hypothetical protein